MARFADKIALVTDAGKGAGRATAMTLAAAGARVIVHYTRDADAAKAVVEEIRAAGGCADAVPADLSAPDGPHRLAAIVRDLAGGHLDILVSATCLSKAVPLEHMTPRDFNELFEVNVRGPYFLVQQLLPLLRQGGNIVFLTSLGVHGVAGSLSAYVSSKGALNSLMKYFAATLRPHGIRVNTVASGVDEAEIFDFLRDDEGCSTAPGIQMTNSVTQSADVASVVAFLVSDEANWITGDTIAVDDSPRMGDCQ